MNKGKTIQLKNINIFFLALISIICIVLTVFISYLGISFKKYTEIADQYSEISRAALELQESSDYLTEEARLFVLSTEVKHVENYFKETELTQEKLHAVEKILKSGQTEQAVEYLIKAYENSIELEKKELYAMKLVVKSKHIDEIPDIVLPQKLLDTQLDEDDELLNDEYKNAQAWLILFSQDYISAKHQISNDKNKSVSEIFEYSESKYKESITQLKKIFFRMIICIVLIFLSNLLYFIFIIILVIKPIYGHIDDIRNGNKLKRSKTRELNILSDTFNDLYNKTETTEQLLRQKAEHDELTGLYNRLAYKEFIHTLSKPDENIALISFDIDYFKQINDGYGHLIGDKALQHIANVFRDSFRAKDYIARLGGDEFVVIVSDCPADIQKIRELITAKLTKVQKILQENTENLPKITFSAGIDISLQGYTEQLYKNADIALYDVKESGRNNFKFYDSSMRDKSE